MHQLQPFFNVFLTQDTSVLEFFATFSRFECALKRARYVKKGAYGSAIPDWDSFANKASVQLAALTDSAFTDAKLYLNSAPPQKQTFIESDRSMKWSPNTKRSGESEEQYLLRLVRDVRNNLFHGGKYPGPDGGRVDDTALRNRQLLQACLAILDNCRRLDTNVEHFFDET